MTQHLKTPEFKSEAEEASWWDNNQNLVLKEFETAAKNGTLGRGTLVRRGQTPTTTIRLDPVDIELAKSQAEQRGLKYQTYLKMLIHQALRQDKHPKKATKAAFQRLTTVLPEHRKQVLIHQALRQDDHAKKVTKAAIQRLTTVPPERRKHV
jgi:predicted DNA binding CopG/RHH family protein